MDLVLVARPSIAPRSAGAVERDYLAALLRVGLLQSDQAPGPSESIVSGGSPPESSPTA